MVYEMFLGSVLCCPLYYRGKQMSEKVHGFILQAWEERCHTDFSCCSPGKLTDLPGFRVWFSVCLWDEASELRRRQPYSMVQNTLSLFEFACKLLCCLNGDWSLLILVFLVVLCWKENQAYSSFLFLYWKNSQLVLIQGRICNTLRCN